MDNAFPVSSVSVIVFYSQENEYSLRKDKNNEWEYLKVGESINLVNGVATNTTNRTQLYIHSIKVNTVHVICLIGTCRWEVLI